VVNVGDGSALKVTGNFIENHPSKLSAQLPALTAGTYRVRVITQYSSGGTALKEPRQINHEAELVVT
jgi:hypothetical protein